MINICIIDDEISFLDTIQDELNEIFQALDYPFQADVFLTFKDIDQLKDYDLYFLDIQMPGRNGFEIAEELFYKDYVKIVYVTAMDDFMIDSFAHHPYDFVCKSKLHDHLRRVVKRYIKEDGRILTIHQYGKDIKIHWKNIEMIQAKRNTVSVFTDIQSFSIRISLSKFLKDNNFLDEPFFMRIHQSYIVNLHKIRSVEKDEITLANGEKAYISRKYSDVFRKKYYNIFLRKEGWIG